MNPWIPPLVFLVLAGCSVERRHVPGLDPDLPFSNAVAIGNAVFVGGHLGLDPATGRAPEDPREEVRLLLDSVQATLRAAGMDFDDFVQVEVYCSDVSLYDVFNQEYRSRFAAPFPARAFIGSGQLLFGARFEMLGIAAAR